MACAPARPVTGVPHGMVSRRPLSESGYALLTVGERRPRLAIARGARWERGGQCATTRRAAPAACGLDPARVAFRNLFVELGRDDRAGDGTAVRGRPGGAGAPRRGGPGARACPAATSPTRPRATVIAATIRIPPMEGAEPAAIETICVARAGQRRGGGVR